MKNIILSLLCLVVLIALTGVYNLGLKLLFDNVLFGVFKWFNGIGFIWKITICLFGGISVFMGLAYSITFIGAILGVVLHRMFPYSKPVFIASIVVYSINLLLWALEFIKAFPPFNFWVFVEFVFSICLVGASSSVFIFWDVDKLKWENSPVRKRLKERQRIWAQIDKEEREFNLRGRKNQPNGYNE